MTKPTLLHYFICEICNKDMIDTSIRQVHICDQCLGHNNDKL